MKIQLNRYYSRSNTFAFSMEKFSFSSFSSMILAQNGGFYIPTRQLKSEIISHLSRIWSWSIMVDILTLSSSGRLSRSPSMLLSMVDRSSVP